MGDNTGYMCNCKANTQAVYSCYKNIVYSQTPLSGSGYQDDSFDDCNFFKSIITVVQFFFKLKHFK